MHVEIIAIATVSPGDEVASVGAACCSECRSLEMPHYVVVQHPPKLLIYDSRLHTENRVPKGLAFDDDSVIKSSRS